MTLQEYLKQKGAQTRLAQQLGVYQSAVSQWVLGKTKITAERAIQIEAATNGLVTRHEMRPDLYPEQPKSRPRKRNGNGENRVTDN